MLLFTLNFGKTPQKLYNNNKLYLRGIKSIKRAQIRYVTLHFADVIGEARYQLLTNLSFRLCSHSDTEVSVISRSRKLRLITLTETLIIPDITKTESNNCFIIHCFEENNDKRIIAAITVYFQTLKNVQLSDKQIFTVWIFFSLRYSWNSSFATFVDLLVFSESLSSSYFSISCWVDEANREAILTSLSVHLTLLLEIMHCARNPQIIH